MKRMKASALGIAILSVIVFGCKKDNNSGDKPTTEVSTTQQLSISDDQVNDGLATAFDAADGTEDGTVQMRENSCAVITLDSVQKKITIDFGSGCVSPVTGRTRAGKIIVGYNGSSYLTATERTYQFVNYHSRDSVLLNGTFLLNNLTFGASSIGYTLSSTDFTFTFPDQKTHVLSTFTRTYNIDLGANLSDNSDNVTTITGGTTGINREGENYTLTITSPVTIKGECTAASIFYPAAGSYEVQIANKPKFSISWGNGNCDKVISITFLGTTIDVNLY